MEHSHGTKSLINCVFLSNACESFKTIKQIRTRQKLKFHVQLTILIQRKLPQIFVGLKSSNFLLFPLSFPCQYHPKKYIKNQESIYITYCWCYATIMIFLELTNQPPPPSLFLTSFPLLASGVNWMNEDPSPCTTKFGINCGGLSLFGFTWS